MKTFSQSSNQLPNIMIPSIPRRRFLGSAAATVAWSALPSLAAETPPGSKIRLGLIGRGWWGLLDAKAALKSGGVEVVAVCDIDSDHLAAAVEEITKLGLEYHLVTAYTSLLAVDRSKKVSDGDIPTVQQPVPTPEGTSASNFNAAPASPAPMPYAVATPSYAMKAPKAKYKDELDDLVGGKKDPGAAVNSPEALSNAQISAVMKKANASSCLAIGAGKVQIKVTINSAGSVTNVTADGTPLGNCLAGIIRRLKFPAISLASQTFPYPFEVK